MPFYIKINADEFPSVFSHNTTLKFYSVDLPASSINCAGRRSPAVAESATSPTDHADQLQHVNQYHESDSATSISTGM